MDRIYASSRPVNLMKKDLIIEAAVEALPLKQKIFKDLSQRCREDCTLATNLSTPDSKPSRFDQKPRARRRATLLIQSTACLWSKLYGRHRHPTPHSALPYNLFRDWKDARHRQRFAWV